MESLGSATALPCFLLDYGFHQGTRGPCCHTPHFDHVRGYDDLKQSPVYIEIKQSMRNGQWHERCHECRAIESAQTHKDHPSKRQLWLSAYDQHSAPNRNLSVLTLDTGRLCNLSCRSCHPFLSTSWSKEWQQMNFVPPMNDVPAKVDHAWLSEQNLQDLIQIEVMGGEPIYNLQSVAPIIERAIKETNGRVVVSMITNGTLFPDIKQYPWFVNNKNIRIVVSIDAVGAAAEFIRTGTVWSKVQDNIHKYQDIGVSLSYHVTHSILNVFEVDKICGWAERHGIVNAGLLTVVDHPKYLTFSVLRPDEKIQMVDKISNSPAEYLVPYLQASSYDAGNRDKFELFMAHTRSYHSMDWIEYLPDLARIMA